jgi:hypothetical protein
MNWLGWSTRAMIGALLGAILGALAFAWGLGHDWDAPYLVGLFTGAGALVTSPDRSVMRGLMVTTLAIWFGALAQAFAGPYRSAGILGFHATLSLPRAVAYGVSGLLAFLLGGTSLRRDASRRAPGA